MSDSEIYNAEISEDWMLAEGRRPSGKFFKNTTVATILALIFVSSTTLYFFLDEEAIDYGTSMTFDQERTRSYAQDLVDLLENGKLLLEKEKVGKPAEMS